MRLAQVLLVGILLITPWCYGSVHESVQVWILVAMAAATLSLVVHLVIRREGQPKVLPVALLPLLAAVLFGQFQLLPLPPGLLSLISPHTAELYGELLADDSASDTKLYEQANLTRENSYQTITLRRTATRYDLSLLTMGVAAFFLAATLFSASREQYWLFLLVAVNGTLLAFFGLVQKLTWNGQLFWIGDVPSNNNPFASFVNRNNAGGYLNMCLAAGLGVLAYAVTPGGNRHDEPSKTMRRRLGWSHTFDSGILSEFFADLNASKLVALCMVICMSAAILATLSRGAGLALLGAGLVTSVVAGMTQPRRSQLAWLLLPAAAAVGLVAWVGLYDALVARMGTLSDREQLASSGRVPNWIAALRSVAGFPLTGSGLGTYRDIYSIYQDRFVASWFYYAENQYVQGVVEAGIPGLILLIASIALVAMACWRLLNRRIDTMTYACAVVGTFALCSQAIAGFFDFGLYLPANMLLLAVISGAVTARAATISADQQNAVRRTVAFSPGWSGTTALSVAAILLLGILLSIREVRGIVAARQTLIDADYSQIPGGATEGELRAAIDELRTMTNQRPDDAELHYVAAKTWEHLYRLQRLPQLRRDAPPDVRFDSLWRDASTTAVHREAQKHARQGATDQLQMLLADPLVHDNLRPALRHQLLARAACPILPKVHLRLARLSTLSGQPDGDRAHVARARRLAPSDPYTHVECGLLDAQSGRVDDACQSWRHALTLSTEYLDDVLEYARPYLSMTAIVERVLPESPAYLLQLCDDHRFAVPEHETTREALLQHASRVMDTAELPDDERHYLRAAIYQRNNEHAKALAEYAKAVQRSPHQITWRYHYGQLLLEQGQLDEALRQARWCARSQPDSLDYRNLLQRIHRIRNTNPR